MNAFYRWATGKRHNSPVAQPPYHWERPDLKDPPLRPLPASRPRRLTHAEDTDTQQQSLLIARLPAEIRVLIWDLTIGREDDADVLHMELADGILRFNDCYQRDSPNPGFQHKCWTAPWRKSMRRGGLRGAEEPESHSRRTLLPLLLTCKLVYTESLVLLYSSNTFDFRRTDALLRLPHIFLPDRLSQVRRIQFSTAFACYNPPDLPPGLPADFWKLPDDRRQWPTTCELLASLRELQHVKITLVLLCQTDRHRHDRAALMYELLLPLKAVSAADFTVEITELLDTMTARPGQTPFRLVEKEVPENV